MTQSNAQTRSLGTEENIGHDNLAIGLPGSLPGADLIMEITEVMGSPETIQPPEVGFTKPHIAPGGHYQTLDIANGRSHNFYPDLVRVSGAASSQSEV